ncbi:tetratricopeptide repeat protein 7B-like [Ruditapes philippinarum]|uniref:tetratricopeptide repeat protein 7B-like n=1 Tax=Ruditapes philippinarum TaxID=129788 RepID=UPI00295BFC9D|nr:tetratricopeptide repeat protein 7B-like [Ruditapes philippinarum]
MAAKTKSSRLQSEIEKCRVEGLWTKALELIKQFSSKNTALDYYVHFILGESYLEAYAKEQKVSEQHATPGSPQEKDKLADAERHLKVVLKENGKMHLEATLLQAKVHFYQCSYQSALTMYEHANLDTVTVSGSSPRVLHIIAEAYAIKGLCLEKLPTSTTSKFKAAEKEDKILSCFEMAGDLCLLYLQEKEKTVQSWGPVPLTEPEESNVGDILETAIQQSPIYYIKHGELEKGVKRFRELLSAVESRYTQHLRLTLARQLAEVLLRGVCESSYVCPDPVLTNNNTARQTGLSPRKYTSDKVFVPCNESEEALLLLLIAEAVASREAILNRTVEHKEGRLHTFQNASAVFDLLAIALVKRAQFHKLADTLEHAMKFSFEEYHIWHQFANSLICDKQYERALQVLKECHRLRPKLVIPVLQAAKLCYEHLHKYDEGIEFAKLALEAGDEHPAASRVHVALGIGHSLKAAEMKLKADRQALHNKALRAFQKAHILDPNDYLSLFHLALQMAILRQIEDAVRYTKLALKHYSDHIHSLHLLVLLLTAQKQYQDAMDLIHAALEEYPDNISLLFTKSKIEEILYGSEVALNTCQNMMKLWKKLDEMHIEETDKRSIKHLQKSSLTTTDRSQFDRKSQANLQLHELHDTISVRAESLAVSRVEETLSILASSSIGDSGGSQSFTMSKTLRLQAQIWMNLSDLYLSLDKVEEAESCVRETAALFPLSHQVAYMKGRIFEHTNKFKEAKESYESAISLNPFHTKSLQHLGMVLHYLDSNKLAEKVLRDAVNADPTSNKSWYCLGVVLEALGQSEAAVNCQLTALDLESSSPIVPFHVIPKLMQ